MVLHHAHIVIRSTNSFKNFWLHQVKHAKIMGHAVSFYTSFHQCHTSFFRGFLSVVQNAISQISWNQLMDSCQTFLNSCQTILKCCQTFIKNRQLNLDAYDILKKGNLIIVDSFSLFIKKIHSIKDSCQSFIGRLPFILTSCHTVLVRCQSFFKKWLCPSVCADRNNCRTGTFMCCILLIYKLKTSIFFAKNHKGMTVSAWYRTMPCCGFSFVMEWSAFLFLVGSVNPTGKVVNHPLLKAN